MDVLIGILIFVASMGLPYLYFYRLNPYRRNLKKGIKFYTQKKYNEAVESFTNCLKKYPDDIESLINRAYSFMRLNDYPNAEADINRALAVKPDKLKLLLVAGTIHSQFKNYSQAITYWDAALTQWKDYTVYLSRGSAYLFLRKYDLALNDFNTSISIKPYYLTYSNRAYVYLQLAEYEKAIADCNEALRLNPKSSEPYDTRGFAYANLKEFKKAFEDFERSLEMYPENAYLFKHRGITYMMIEDFTKAKQDLGKAIELDKSFKEEIRPYLKQIADKSA